MRYDKGTCLAAARNVLWHQDTSCGQQTWLVATRHVLLLKDMSRRHTTCLVTTAQVLWPQDIAWGLKTCLGASRYAFWPQNMSCGHKICPAATRHISGPQDMSCCDIVLWPWDMSVGTGTCLAPSRHALWPQDQCTAWQSGVNCAVARKTGALQSIKCCIQRTTKRWLPSPFCGQHDSVVSKYDFVVTWACDKKMYEKLNCAKKSWVTLSTIISGLCRQKC